MDRKIDGVRLLALCLAFDGFGRGRRGRRDDSALSSRVVIPSTLHSIFKPTPMELANHRSRRATPPPSPGRAGFNCCARSAPRLPKMTTSRGALSDPRCGAESRGKRETRGT